MKREPEDELMDGEAQARAYADADLANASWLFVEYFKKNFRGNAPQTILDIGCGPADIAVRFARIFHSCDIHALDGASQMLAYGEKAVNNAGLGNRITLIKGKLGYVDLPLHKYAAIISNNFLHHLKDPQLLWDSINTFGQPGSCVMVMDLIRPENEKEVDEIVQTIMPTEPHILQSDFSRSLRAAYSIDEVERQLRQAGLEESIMLSRVSPIQFMAHGVLD